MFCPTCGRDNLIERKFCSSCGTNLEAISQLLSGNRTNFFTRIDSGLDQFIARYSEHIFKEAPTDATDRSVKNSWRLLGKGVVTSFVDLFLSLVIWNVFTVRFNILWISTPFRLLSERSERQKRLKEAIEQDTTTKLREPPEQKWLPGQVISVSEHTTEHLQDYQPPRRKESQTRE